MIFYQQQKTGVLEKKKPERISYYEDIEHVSLKVKSMADFLFETMPLDSIVLTLEMNFRNTEQDGVHQKASLHEWLSSSAKRMSNLKARIMELFSSYEGV